MSNGAHWQANPTTCLGFCTGRSLCSCCKPPSGKNRQFLLGPDVFECGRLFTVSNDALRFCVLRGKLSSFKNRLN